MVQGIINFFTGNDNKPSALPPQNNDILKDNDRLNGIVKTQLVSQESTPTQKKPSEFIDKKSAINMFIFLALAASIGLAYFVGAHIPLHILGNTEWFPELFILFPSLVTTYSLARYNTWKKDGISKWELGALAVAAAAAGAGILGGSAIISAFSTNTLSLVGSAAISTWSNFVAYKWYKHKEEEDKLPTLE